MTVTTRTEIDDFKVTAMSLPGGMVWKWALQRRRRITRVAKELCPKGPTRDLSNSIEGHFNPAPMDHIIMEVSASTPYANAVHQGRWEYRIYPKSPAGRLSFYWKREGRGFLGRPGQGITHPPYKSQPFLKDALEGVMADVIANPHG